MKKATGGFILSRMVLFVFVFVVGLTVAHAEATGFQLSWEDGSPGRSDWSRFLLNTVARELPSLDQALDIQNFCPAYRRLNGHQKTQAWSEVVVGVSKLESNWQFTERFLEPTHRQDVVTHARVYSEGLLQLSYQDIKSYPFCDFKWPIDRMLHVNDPRKTIFNPYTNLTCGVKILSHQINHAHRIHIQNSYWSTLRREKAVTLIAARVRNLNFCK